jgi:hypothetical protein
MAVTERRIEYRVPIGLEAAVRGFAEAMGMRVVAYASVEGLRAYCVLCGKGGTGRDERLYFAALAGGALRIEPVPEIEGCPHLTADIIALVKRADVPLEKAVD